MNFFSVSAWIVCNIHALHDTEFFRELKEFCVYLWEAGERTLKCESQVRYLFNDFKGHVEGSNMKESYESA